MQRENHTPRKGTALSFIRAIAAQFARTGNLRARDLAELERIDRENTILERVVQLGYLTEEQITQVTGVAKGLTKTLQDLCENDLLRRIKVDGVVVYRIRPEGLRRVPTIEVPGFGVIDLTTNSSFVTTFCGSSVSLPLTMPHLLGCSELAVKLHLSTNSTVLSDRTARLVEKLYNQGKRAGQKRQIAVANGGHMADLAAISPLGEVTVYQLELSSHSNTEGEAVCLDLVQSGQIVRVVYVAETETLLKEVERRFSAVAEDYPDDAGAVQKCVAVKYSGKGMPAISKIMPAGACRSTAHRRVVRA